MANEGLAKRIADLPPQLKASLERRLRELRPPQPAAIAGRGAAAPPLSFAQERLWFLNQWEPGLAAYNLPLLLPLPTGVESGAVERAVNSIVQRHAVLRGVVAQGAGLPVQRIAAAAAVALPRHEAPDAAALQAVLHAECAQPFALEAEPPLRANLFRGPAGESWLLVVFHHIACDGTSLAVFRHEFDTLLAAGGTAPASALPPLPIQYGDYARWQRDELAGPRGALLLDHWMRALDGAPDNLALPCDRPAPARRGHAGAVHVRPIGAPLAQALRALAQAERASLFAALLANFLALLHRVCGQTDLLVGIPATHRGRRELEPLIGLFVNTLVVRSRIDAATSWRGLLRAVRATVLDAHEHQDFPFEQLVAARSDSRDAGRPALVQAFFALQNGDTRPAQRSEAPAAPDDPVRSSIEDATGWAKFELTLTVVEQRDALSGVWEYSTERFDASTVHMLAEVYEALLAAGLAEPERALRTIPLLPSARADAPSAGPRLADGLTLHAMVAAQAARTPDAAALLDDGTAVSYGELMHRAGELAARLRAEGAAPRCRIGICLGRRAAMVEALLAVLQTGGAYVPLDPQYPADRLAWMADDAQLAMVLTDEAHRDRAASALAAGRGVPLVVLGAEPPPQAGEPREPAGPATDPEDIAYVIYTSGSTGRPKGVMVPHRAVASHMQWMLAEWPLGPGDRVLQRTSLSFDASVLEVFAPLMSGACLVLSRHEAGELAQMADEVRRHRITVLQLVPSLLQMLLDRGGLEDCPQLRLLFCGGEALPARLVEPFLRPGGPTIVNLYGPTEAAIDATFHTVRAPVPGAIVPIGVPIARVRAHVLDDAWQPVPPGVTGELFLGGVALARGYMGRPDLTADRFVPDACSGEPGARLYRTGDLVRRRADGVFEYVGRRDDQVKLRGVRIELREIEASLAALPEVAAAAAAVVGDVLAAWIVPRGDAVPSAQALRAGLQAVLPRHMLPSLYFALPALPLMPNGKLDRAALQPHAGALPMPASAHVPASTPTERVLAGLFEELLGVHPVGIESDFFQLGGHSLLATQLSSRVHDRFGVALPLRQVFETPGVAALAACIDELCGASMAAVLAEAGDLGSLAALSDPQRRRLAVAVEHLPEEALDAMLRLVLPPADAAAAPRAQAPLSDSQEA